MKRILPLMALLCALCLPAGAARKLTDKDVLQTMKAATTFMVEKSP